MSSVICSSDPPWNAMNPTVAERSTLISVTPGWASSSANISGSPRDSGRAPPAHGQRDHDADGGCQHDADPQRSGVAHPLVDRGVPVGHDLGRSSVAGVEVPYAQLVPAVVGDVDAGQHEQT